MFESEPNDSTATANPLGSAPDLVIQARIFPGRSGPTGGDVDYYSFTANAGDRIYAASFSGLNRNNVVNGDPFLEIIASDGTTVLESDNDDGSLGAVSAVIAGTVLPTTGTYYIRALYNPAAIFGGINFELRPYELHVKLQSGTPTAEVEPNDTPATATPLGPNGWAAGTRDPAAGTEVDFYSLALNAGDSVAIVVDLDPERDNVPWCVAPCLGGRVGMGLFGDALSLVLSVDDANTGTAANPPAEALFFTVKNAGTYFFRVDSATATAGGPAATYNLSVSVHPAVTVGVNCTTYTSTDVPKAIPTAAAGPIQVDSTLTIPGNPRIYDLDVTINLTHAAMPDLDVTLRAPNGAENPLFLDIGAAGQTIMDTTWDQQAAINAQAVQNGHIYHVPAALTGDLFDGNLAGGTWTLRLRDDTPATGAGNLTGWSMRICEAPPAPACAGTMVNVYSQDFEASDGGYTHSGAPDEWQYGTPVVPSSIVGCASGVSCWKTDLDNTYNVDSSMDLFTPPISLAGVTSPIILTWNGAHQMENASFDHAFAEVRSAGGGNETRVWGWEGATMRTTTTLGNPAINPFLFLANWGQRSADISSYAGQNIDLRWHLDADSSLVFSGLGVDDVAITACCTALSCDDGDPCTVDTCDTGLGCIHAAGNDGANCDDANPCTETDVCGGGLCAGTPIVCDDADACTSNACNTLNGQCVFTAITCDDSNPCTDNACNSLSGCFFTNNTDACDDANACTSGDVCGGGLCAGTPSVICNDGDACTVDSCVPSTGLCATAPVVCDDSNGCTDNGCNSLSGCTFTNNTAPCDDADACTSNDTCGGGACLGGGATNCDDADVCTTDGCNSLSGCNHTPNTASCDDGNVCTGSDVCGQPPGFCVVTQNFDGVIPTDLPAGWTSTVLFGDSSEAWGSSSSNSFSIPNSAFTPDTGVVADKVLDSLPVQIASATAQLHFRNYYDTDDAPNHLNSFDGAVLEIQIGAGPFQDILDAGGSFVSGGYNRTIYIFFSNPLGGRAAWGGNSGGFVDTVVNLPASASGQTIVLRWRFGSDDSVGGLGQFVDDVLVTQTLCPFHVCNGGAPVAGSCDDANPCTSGDACDNGVCTGAPVTAPEDVAEVGSANVLGVTLVAWTDTPGATQYDAVRGLLSGLPAGPGGGDEVCFPDLTDRFLVDLDTPPLGDGFWFIVRGQNACTVGSYGLDGQGNPRNTTTCP
ncbi:MAG TPA: pre-peptidase C-terminal domain-containing protein [Candidatus Polarisedimenticolaceae bacterium]|nr:pre-peptidase C-terminal domain-containing protein [Candidatus Polarisedimenticolaceae bacterium]